MSDDAPRAPARIHLSTCVILLFAVGALIGANLYPQKSSVPRRSPGGGIVIDASVRTNYGWPFVGKVVVSNAFESIDEWKLDNVVFDVFVNAAILYLTAQLCEWRIRRWEKARAEKTRGPT